MLQRELLVHVKLGSSVQYVSQIGSSNAPGGISSWVIQQRCGGGDERERERERECECGLNGSTDHPAWRDLSLRTGWPTSWSESSEKLREPQQELESPQQFINYHGGMSITWMGRIASGGSKGCNPSCAESKGKAEHARQLFFFSLLLLLGFF